MPNPYHLTSNPDPNHAAAGHSVEAPRGGLKHLTLVGGCQPHTSLIEFDESGFNYYFVLCEY